MDWGGGEVEKKVKRGRDCTHVPPPPFSIHTWLSKRLVEVLQRKGEGRRRREEGWLAEGGREKGELNTFIKAKKSPPLQRTRHTNKHRKCEMTKLSP